MPEYLGEERDTVEVSVSRSEENALVRKFQSDLNASSAKWDYAFKNIKVSRRAAYGHVMGRASRANLIHATNAAMLPLIYAKNPKIKVTPKEQVSVPGQSEYQQLRQLAQTVEITMNALLTDRKAGLKTALQRAVRSVQASKVGWFKCTFQHDVRTDPQIESQLVDVTQDINRLQGLIMSIQESMDSDVDNIRAKQEQLVYLKQSLEKTLDIEVAKGFAFDYLDPLDLRMDPTKNLQDYRQARWISHRMWFDRDTAQERFQLTQEEMAGLKWYVKDGQETYLNEGSGMGMNFMADPTPVTGQTANSNIEERYVVPVWERWDQHSKTVYTMGEGKIDRMLREPYQPQRVGQRWYPFFMMAWGWVDGEDWPLSDTEEMVQLQDEYNATRDQQDAHREASKPFWVTDRTTKQGDIEKFEHPEIGTIIVVDANGNPVAQMFQIAPVPPWNPAIYDTSQIRADFEWVTGLQDAQRGGVQKAKTLGEAELIQQGLNDKVAEKKDTIEECMTEMTTYATEIAYWEYTQPEIKMIAGIHALWPTVVTPETVAAMAVEVEAGSTVKPNAQKELKQWIEMMPMMQQTIQAAQELRGQGIPDMVNPYIRLAEETFRRTDDRFDIEQIIPPLNEMMMAMLQQQMMMQNGPGPQGPQGSPGPAGPQGPQGPQQQQSLGPPAQRAA